MKKLILAFALSIFLVPISFGVFRFVDDSDIPQWAYDSIYIVREQNIMQGFPDGTFGSRKNINRAQALVLLFRTQEVDFQDFEKTQEKFTDIPEGAWFTNAVYKAIEKGWVNGFSDNTFRPEKELNRAEWATLVQRAFELVPAPENLSKFEDVPNDVWFTDPVHAFYKNELIRYPNVATFEPGKIVTRGEAAWTINEILGKPRLMGTSASNDFSKNIQRNSREVAIKPRNFDANLQGVESTRKELEILSNRDEVPKEISANSDWVSIGNLRIKNTFPERVTLNSLEFAMRFKLSGIGPSGEFLLKITAPGYEKIQEFSRGNTNFITGIGIDILPEEEKIFKINIKPKENPKFYTKSGIATVSISRAEAITISSFSTDESNPNQAYETNLKQTPIKFISRNLTDLLLDPYPQP